MEGWSGAYIDVHRLAIRVLDGRVIALDEDALHELRCLFADSASLPRIVKRAGVRTGQAAFADTAGADDCYVIFSAASISSGALRRRQRRGWYRTSGLAT